MRVCTRMSLHLGVQTGTCNRCKFAAFTGAKVRLCLQTWIVGTSNVHPYQESYKFAPLCCSCLYRVQTWTIISVCVSWLYMYTQCVTEKLNDVQSSLLKISQKILYSASRKNRTLKQWNAASKLWGVWPLSWIYISWIMINMLSTDT